MARTRRVALLLTVVAFGAGGCSSNTSSGMGSTASSPGERTYQQQCASCHGSGRQGLGAIPAIDPARIEELGEAEVRRIVVEGQGAMPSFGDDLSGVELDALVTYLLTPDG